MTVLCINNSSRSGTLANMTLRQFEEATKEDECFVVRVKDHKMFTTHGPVNVVFTASLYKYTQIFIKNFRNCLGDVSIDGDSPVFLSVNQRKMMSSQVGAQIGSCWGKVFGKETSLGGATAFRKAAVSAVHESNEEMRGDLADLMVHKQSTADRYYLLRNKGKSAVKTSKELAKIMRSGGTNEPEKFAENDVPPSRQSPSENQSGRCKWTSAEINELRSAFSSHINRKSVTIEQVRGTVKNVPILQSIPHKKVLDKVRSFFGKDSSESAESPSLPTEQDSLDDRLKRAGLEKHRTYNGKLIAFKVIVKNNVRFSAGCMHWLYEVKIL